jgi:O-antigen/teichoic acid export membrane protein
MDFLVVLSNFKLEYRKKITSIPLGLKQTAFMFVATSITGAVNYLVHFATSRMLGPSDYGIFASLNSFYTLIYTPIGILTLVTAYYLAQFHACGEVHRSSPFLVDITKWVSLIMVIISLAIALSSSLLAKFLQIPSAIPILIVAITLLIGSLLAIYTGALHGLQKFFAWGFIAIISGSLRLAFAIGLVAMGLHAAGALAAQLFSVLVTLSIALVILRPLFNRYSIAQTLKHGLTLKEITAYAGLVLVGTTCVAAMTNMDVIVVKHFFPPSMAGQYAAASVLAKVILFFPAAITAVLFPKATERFTLKQDSSMIARQAIIAVAGLCGTLSIVFFLIPGFLIHLLFGSGYEAAMPLLGLFGLTMALYALVTVQMTYYLSIRRMLYIPIIAGSTLILVIALVLFHQSLLEIITIQLVNAAVLLVVSEIFLRGIIMVPLIKKND